VRGPKAISAVGIATALGAGLLPKAPGTWGTIAAIPVVIWINPADPLAKLLLWLGLFIAGTWASRIIDELMSSADNQNIVMDEVVGYGIAAWTAGTDVKWLAIAFVLFRFFDMVKPFPIRQLDEWSKIQAGKKSGRASSWWGGFGVMADDVLAGFQSLAIVWILQNYTQV
jgi:phosphatidylglycerophosphatase A